MSLRLVRFTILGNGIFDTFDKITHLYYNAIGGYLSHYLLAGSGVKEKAKNEVTNNGTVKFALFDV